LKSDKHNTYQYFQPEINSTIGLPAKGVPRELNGRGTQAEGFRLGTAPKKKIPQEEGNLI